jgi:hypothetical protein
MTGLNLCSLPPFYFLSYPQSHSCWLLYCAQPWNHLCNKHSVDVISTDHLCLKLVSSENNKRKLCHPCNKYSWDSINVEDLHLKVLTSSGNKQKNYSNVEDFCLKLILHTGVKQEQSMCSYLMKVW